MYGGLLDKDKDSLIYGAVLLIKIIKKDD